ncbi:tubulin-specific chaperone D-like [Haliotis rufescens]|uniref:tubulin-specific chaperone D-like n=1 Tax=Haliotis rufescens TaxID=6454 RepID=UPI00201F5F48|nr:tubulin-specific chaperone D-like [Haliotis rufescens]
MAAATESSSVMEVEDTEGDEQKAYHEEFKEIEEIRSLIDGLKDVYDDLRSLEMSCERFTCIIDSYQEQPHLIDPHLESLLLQLLNQARNPDTPVPVVHLAFKYIYLITKMRGFKIVVRLLPHEVVDVEPVLALLKLQDPHDFKNWESRYILVLWLAMVCMIPFDMVRLDGSMKTEAGEKKQPVMDRIIEVGKTYLSVSGKSRDAAAFLISRFMTRPDVVKHKLPGFLDWCIQILHTADRKTMMGTNLLSGVLMTMALLFKQSKREDLLQYAPTVLTNVRESNMMESGNTILRKLTVKLIQRLGLTFLKNRVAAWRYQRGSRSLTENLKQTKQSSNTENKLDQDNDDDIEVPEEIEDVIEQLLGGLRDKDTIVRWSAAKGIGRVTGRLPKELADEVVGSVLELFSLQETDGAWHGGCLALAELGRRGLLVPQRLPDVVPVVLRALAYDERRGNFSVGAHVRDAACYVNWAFARAYDPKEISPYVNKIANGLLVASVFDREVNVRRAASAAFQENVGRQGTFPHGIDILTAADYFTVGMRTYCYQELSVYIAQFKEYSKSMIDHLAQVKSAHWDNAIRELASKSLHNLTAKEPEYVAKTVLPALIENATGIDLHQRHGAILAAAEVAHALSKIAQTQGKCVSDLIDAASTEGLRSIAKKLQDSQLFRGLGGELMRKAVCHLIQKLSESKMPYHGEPIIDIWQEILDDCLFHVEPEIQQASIEAAPAFYTEYCRDAEGKLDTKRRDAVVEKYLKELKSSIEISRMGHSLALGGFPQFMLEGKLMEVLMGLVHASTIKEKSVHMAEARRDAVKAITSIVKTVGVTLTGSPGSCICADNICTVFDALLAAMKDYTLDSRGDVGSWVREASMMGLVGLMSLSVKEDPQLITPDVCERVFCCLIQQACEKIDRTRAVAGSAFIDLLCHKPPLPHIPHKENLDNIFQMANTDYRKEMGNQMKLVWGKMLTDEENRQFGSFVNWASPFETFPRFVQLLDQPKYRYSVLLGMAVSVGGLTESLVKHSSSSMYNYLRGHNYEGEQMEKFVQTVVQIFKDFQKVDRVSVPLLKMIDQMLSKGCFSSFTKTEGHPFPSDMTELVKKELARSGDPNKLMAGADVYCGLLEFPGNTRKNVLLNLVMLLCHRYPRVRKSTANKMYEALVTYDDIVPEESLDEALAILSDTNWDNPVEEIRPIRNTLCDHLNIAKPIIKKTPGKPEGSQGGNV